MSVFSIKEAKELLAQDSTELFYESYNEIIDSVDSQTLNMGDTWMWACAWGEEIKDSEMPALASLYSKYGYCGILYWMSEKYDGMKSEFLDINRFIEFVRQEEQLIKDVPSSNQRAYKNKVYTLGKTTIKPGFIRKFVNRIFSS